MLQRNFLPSITNSVNDKKKWHVNSYHLRKLAPEKAWKCEKIFKLSVVARMQSSQCLRKYRCYLRLNLYWFWEQKLPGAVLFNILYIKSSLQANLFKMEWLCICYSQLIKCCFRQQRSELTSCPTTILLSKVACMSTMPAKGKILCVSTCQNNLV